MCGGLDGALRSFSLDGNHGPLQAPGANPGGIRTLVVVENAGAPLIIAAGREALRSFNLDGTPGALRDESYGAFWALAVAEDAGVPTIVGGGMDGELRSLNLDGTPGPLHRFDAHYVPINALVVIEHAGAPMIISGSHGGVLRSFNLDGTPECFRSRRRAATRSWCWPMCNVPVRL